MTIPFHQVRMLICLLVSASGFPAAHASLTHRYSFNEAAARDLVGNINGKLKGPGATIADGKLILKNDATAIGEAISCLEFPASLLPKSGSVSLVIWFTVKNAGAFSRLINFGSSEGTEGTHFIYLSPSAGDVGARAAITGGDVSSKTAVDFTACDDGKPHMIALVVDGASKKLRVLLDGTEPAAAETLGENTLDKVKALENWLGKSSFAADPGLSGAIDEFRVYDHALTPAEAAALHQAGPDVVPTAGPMAK
jgi:hypothetical protein